MPSENNDTYKNRQTAYPFRRNDAAILEKKVTGYSEQENRLQSMMDKQFKSVKTGPDYTKIQSKSDDINKKILEQKKKEYEELHRKKEKQALSAKEAKEKIIYARELKAFLKQSDEMLLEKFFVIRNERDFMSKIQQKTGLSDITGVYIICNTMKRKVYVGKHNNAFDACWQIFRDRSVSKNYIATIKDDFDDGDQMVVNFVKLKDTQYNTLDELEAAYVEKYNSIQDGYNFKLGAKAKRHWYSYQ